MKVRKIENYKNFYELQGYPDTIEKKDARILFRTRHAKLEDLIVEEFVLGDIKEHLYKEYPRDIGNCLSDWSKWTLADVFFKIFVSLDVPAYLRKKVLFEISKIREFREEMTIWLYQNWGESLD